MAKQWCPDARCLQTLAATRFNRQSQTRSMPYFFIIPAYVLLLLMLGISAVVLGAGAGERRAAGRIFAGMAGTVPGMIAANGVVTLAGIAPLWVAGQVSLPEWLSLALSGFAMVCLFIGPFVASAIGVIAGFLCGWWLAARGGK